MSKISDFFKEGLSNPQSTAPLPDDSESDAGGYFDEVVELHQDISGLGWNLFPRQMGKYLFEEMRGHDNRDYAVFTEITAEGGRILDFIDVGGAEDNSVAGDKMNALKEAVVANAPQGQLAPADIRIFRNNKDSSAVYIQGDNSIIAVGYHDTSGSPKGVMMCALMLYTFAQLNYKRDKALFLNTYDYLPFRPDIGLDFSFYRLADELIEEILDQNEDDQQEEQ